MSDDSFNDELFFMEQENRRHSMQNIPAGSAASDEDGLPAESFDMYSDLPLDFEEMASGLRKDLYEVYEMTGKLNRFSRNYPVCCRLLEKLIKRAGSFLVTKTALEQAGFTFPRLSDLDMNELYCMVSFNFRKTRTAFHDGKREKGCADLGLLAQECRLVDLAERLKSTEEKIRLITSGKINIESIVERAKMYKGRKRILRSKQAGSTPASTQAHSLPIISSVIRKMIQERKVREKDKSEWERLIAEDPFSAKPFRPMSLKGLENQDISSDFSRSAELACPADNIQPAEQKDNSFIKDTVDRMMNFRPKKQNAPDPELDKELDESLLRVFSAHKKFMSSGVTKAPLPERV